MTAIRENIEAVRASIAECEAAAGRAPGSVRLLAVSKTFPASDIADAFQNAGQIMFGENRVQELAEKVPALPSGIEWHLIGHLQSNKAAKAAALASWIHSVDSAKLLAKLNEAAAGRPLNILLEVNWTGEESKSGIRGTDSLFELAEAAAACPNLNLRGLMTMAESGASEKRLHETFAGVRELRDRLRKSLNLPLPELSMGMSADYRIAIAEGATIVRIGTAVFGRR